MNSGEWLVCDGLRIWLNVKFFNFGYRWILFDWWNRWVCSEFWTPSLLRIELSETKKSNAKAVLENQMVVYVWYVCFCLVFYTENIYYRTTALPRDQASFHLRRLYASERREPLFFPWKHCWSWNSSQTMLRSELRTFVAKADEKKKMNTVSSSNEIVIQRGQVHCEHPNKPCPGRPFGHCCSRPTRHGLVLDILRPPICVRPNSKYLLSIWSPGWCAAHRETLTCPGGGGLGQPHGSKITNYETRFSAGPSSGVWQAICHSYGWQGGSRNFSVSMFSSKNPFN